MHRQDAAAKRDSPHPLAPRTQAGRRRCAGGGGRLQSRGERLQSGGGRLQSRGGGRCAARWMKAGDLIAQRGISLSSSNDTFYEFPSARLLHTRHLTPLTPDVQRRGLMKSCDEAGVS